MIAASLKDPLCGPFWQAAQQQRLVMCWCEPCGCAVWYPQADCPACGLPTGWRQLSGRARLHSWTEVALPINPAFSEPYIVALAVPEEAPAVRLVTRLVACRATDIECDMPLEVCFRPLQGQGDGGTLAPVFRPGHAPG